MNFTNIGDIIRVIFGISVVAGIIGVYVVISDYKSEIKDLQTKNLTLSTSLATSQTSVKNLQDSINNRNKEVDQMKADSDARDRKYQSQIDATNKKAAATIKRANDIMAKRPTLGNDCKDTEQLLNEILFK